MNIETSENSVTSENRVYLVLVNFTPYLKYSDTFIETGSGVGDGIAAALAAGFTTIKSVEASKAHYYRVNSRFQNNKSVTVYFGKSVDRLPEMIAGITCPSVFWLDAHPAGPGSFGHEEWLNRDTSVFQDTVLQQEIKIILEDGNHVVLIDDVNSDESIDRYVNWIEELAPGSYTFDTLNNKKVLVCLPIILDF